MLRSITGASPSAGPVTGASWCSVVMPPPATVERRAPASVPSDHRLRPLVPHQLPLTPLLRGRQHEPVTETLEADYLVVGAGAAGMAFTDALIDHADVRVALVDRRHAPGGHWLDAYPFVRLHQASAFYGVASTLLGGGRVQDQIGRAHV